MQCTRKRDITNSYQHAISTEKINGVRLWQSVANLVTQKGSASKWNSVAHQYNPYKNYCSSIFYTFPKYTSDCDKVWSESSGGGPGTLLTGKSVRWCLWRKEVDFPPYYEWLCFTSNRKTIYLINTVNEMCAWEIKLFVNVLIFPTIIKLVSYLRHQRSRGRIS